MRLVPVLAALVLLAGCKHTFSLPYTVDELLTDSSRWPGDALVHYLSQPNADVGVCDPGRGVLQRYDEELAEPLVQALRDDVLPPERWAACGRLLISPILPPLREFFLGRLARLVLELLERDVAVQRLIAVNDVLDARPREDSPSLDTLLTQLNEFPREKLPSTMPPVFDALVTTLELDHGRLNGKPVTAADIEVVQDDGLLTRMTARLPSEELRMVARRRLVRLHIERSDWPEVKARAAEVEGAVMSYGRWAQSPATLKLERPEPAMALPFQGVVKQSLTEQFATLHAPREADLDVAPTVDLRPHLRFPVGWSRPLSLCRSPRALSVEPCLEVKDVQFLGPGTVDDEGVLRLPERMPMAQVFELARAGEGLPLMVKLSGQLVTSLTVPLRFLTPESNFFEGERAQPGPAVNVVVLSTAEALLLEGVSESGERRYVVLPREGIGQFEFGSRGGPGVVGRDGATGREGRGGIDGLAAGCPGASATDGTPGDDGEPGGPGEDGGPGGDGGPVTVALRCTLECGADSEHVRRIVKSRGGVGGRGGRGGRGGDGGRGGRGGAGKRCDAIELPRGADAARGRSGDSGRDGYDGVDGADGVVTFQ